MAQKTIKNLTKRGNVRLPQNGPKPKPQFTKVAITPHPDALTATLHADGTPRYWWGRHQVTASVYVDERMRRIRAVRSQSACRSDGSLFGEYLATILDQIHQASTCRGPVVCIIGRGFGLQSACRSDGDLEDLGAWFEQYQAGRILMASTCRG